MPSWLLIVVQLLCVVSVAAGVALIYVPAAFIVAGVLVFLVCETPGMVRLRRETEDSS